MVKRLAGPIYIIYVRRMLVDRRVEGNLKGYALNGKSLIQKRSLQLMTLP
jgi:hypothetical protein